MNIVVDLTYPIQDGTEVVFRSPVDCSQVTGLKVYCPDGCQEFAFADAHGNDVGQIDHLFAENVAVKVILDVTTGMAFVQNADTNAYLEAQLASKAPAGYGLGETSSPSKNWNSGYANSFNRGNTNSPDKTMWYGLTCVNGNSDACSTHIAFSQNSGDSVCEARRSRSSAGTWGEWEYVNPPMLEGVEYRTTERFNGKPVYTKIVNCGGIANGKQVEYGNESNYIHAFRFSGVLCSSDGRPMIPLPGAFVRVELDGATQSIIIYDEDSNWGSDHIVFVQIWYVK